MAPSYLGLALFEEGSLKSLPHFSAALHLELDLVIVQESLQRTQRQIDAKKMKRSRDCAEFQFM